VAAWFYLPKDLPVKEAVFLVSNMFGTVIRGWAVVWNGKTIQVKGKINGIFSTLQTNNCYFYGLLLPVYYRKTNGETP
jgi:hypothetical protein